MIQMKMVLLVMTNMTAKKDGDNYSRVAPAILPLFPNMSDDDIDFNVGVLNYRAILGGRYEEDVLGDGSMNSPSEITAATSKLSTFSDLAQKSTDIDASDDVWSSVASLVFSL